MFLAQLPFLSVPRISTPISMIVPRITWLSCVVMKQFTTSPQTIIGLDNIKQRTVEPCETLFKFDETSQPKSIAHQARTSRQSSSALANSDRGFPVFLGREANNPRQQKALLNTTLGEAQIPTDWMSRVEEERRKIAKKI